MIHRLSSVVAKSVPRLVVLVCSLFFAAPLLALARYSFQNVPTILLGWSTLFDKWSVTGVTAVFREEAFWSSLRLSLTLAAGTVVLTIGLLVPTALWVHLRLPRARALLEFITVRPYMVPAIAMVAGIMIIKPHARWFLNSDLALVPFYVVLALPFTYRSLDTGLRAVDLRTLVDAGRSLGAGWPRTMVRVVLPQLRVAIISAVFLTVAVVLGEYTLANTLLIQSLPPYQELFVGREPQAGYALNLLALASTTVLFAVLALVTRPRRRQSSLVRAIVSSPAHSSENPS